MAISPIATKSAVVAKRSDDFEQEGEAAFYGRKIVLHGNRCDWTRTSGCDSAVTVCPTNVLALNT